MATEALKKGVIFLESGHALDGFWIITKGSIEASFFGGRYVLMAGDIIGLADMQADSHFFTYKALENSEVSLFSTPEMLKSTQMFSNSAEHRIAMAKSANRQIRALLSQYNILTYRSKSLYQFIQDTYQSYMKLCDACHAIPSDLPTMEEVVPFTSEKNALVWEPDFHNGFQRILSDASLTENLNKLGIITGYIYEAAGHINEVVSHMAEIQDYCSDRAEILINEDRLDLMDLYTNLLYKVGTLSEQSETLISTIRKIVSQAESQSGNTSDTIKRRFAEYENHLAGLKAQEESGAVSPKEAQELPLALVNSLDTILSYAGCPAELEADFRKTLILYRDLENKNDTTPEVSGIRRALSNLFYQIYEAAFLASMKDSYVPEPLMMFFNFGYVDETITGIDNSCALFELIKKHRSDTAHGVYTVYDWLTAVYKQEKEPSINEFEEDFAKYLRTAKRSGDLTEQEVKEMTENPAQKVSYELRNMFRGVSKIVSGRPLLFCPVLSEHQFLRSPAEVILSPEQVLGELKKISDIDFSIFYREVNTILSEKENLHEFLHTEVRPDIILMPVVGTRGALWQELSGRNHLGPSRMMLPVFELENLSKNLIRMCAEYRWEICKRVQGARWNDVTEPSLTSLYYDYLQFARKNNDLSPEAKEKVRMGLQKVKQNYKKYYIDDYITYITFETQGSPHLNRVARYILYTQCWLRKDIRTSLAENPIFRDLAAKHEITMQNKIKRVEVLIKRFQTRGAKVPESLFREQEFYQM